MSITFSLTVTHNDLVRHFPLGESMSTVGRDPASDIFIGDPAISRLQMTLHPTGEAIRIEMNPKSPNVLVRNGCARMFDEVHPGEYFHVGPYRFEVTVSADLPEPRSRRIAEDPAGPIDLKQLDESERVAPRWRSNEAQSLDVALKPVPAEAAEQPGLSPPMRVVLLASLAMLGGYLIYDFTRPPAAPSAEVNAKTFGSTDLLAAVKPISCDSQVECLERARDSYRIATELLRGSSRDLGTRYKVARHLYRARGALGKSSGQIPDLNELFARANLELKVTFADVAFLYERAVAENQLKEQKEILGILLNLCGEDRHAFCSPVEYAYFRFPDPT